MTVGGMRRRRRTHLALVILVTVLGVSAIAAANDGATIRQAIEGARAQDTRLADTHVGVRVRDGEVILFGSVRLYLQKMLFEQLAWRTVGVTEVDSEIRVEPVHRLPSAAIERQIRRIIKEHERLHGSGLNVRVVGGRVYLSGSFHDPSDVMFLKHRVAEIEGVVAITIDPKFAV
jgi:osmotically-inducible protein OsmY